MSAIIVAVSLALCLLAHPPTADAAKRGKTYKPRTVKVKAHSRRVPGKTVRVRGHRRSKR
jgi:hypothetical protein